MRAGHQTGARVTHLTVARRRSRARIRQDRSYSGKLGSIVIIDVYLSQSEHRLQAALAGGILGSCTPPLAARPWRSRSTCWIRAPRWTPATKRPRRARTRPSERTCGNWRRCYWSVEVIRTRRRMAGGRSRMSCGAERCGVWSGMRSGR